MPKIQNRVGEIINQLNKTMKKFLFIGALIALSLQIVNAQEATTKRRSDRKIIELKKIITISPTQESAIRDAYEASQLTADSILYQVQDAVVAATLKRVSEKKFNQIFMNSLTETQRNKYIRITSTPEVLEKAEAKVAVLQESGNYTQAQLDSAKTEIFNYLMLEKVVYKRDKYDYRKQKENIAQLKKMRPNRLKQAEAQEKLKIQGKAHTGRYQF